jgi:hypothetical protein
VKFVAGARVKLEITGQCQHVGSGLTGGFAAVTLLQRSQLIAVFSDLLRQPHQQSSAVDGTLTRPMGAQAVTGGGDSLVKILRIAALQLVKGVAMGRVYNWQSTSGAGGLPHVGDEVVLHGLIFGQNLNVSLPGLCLRVAR